MNPQQVRILDKLRKLQAHAQSASRIGSLNEYYAFTQRITELLTAYNLTLMDLEKASSCQDIDLDGYCFSERVSCKSSYGVGWRKSLAGVLAAHHLCRSLYHSASSTHSLYGRGENVETVVWLYHFLSVRFEELARQAYAQAQRGPGRKLSAFRFGRHFLLGAKDGLCDYFQAQGHSQEKALMIYNEKALDAFIAKSQITVKKPPRKKKKKVNEYAYWQGVRAGKGILKKERKLPYSSP